MCAKVTAANRQFMSLHYTHKELLAHHHALDEATAKLRHRVTADEGGAVQGVWEEVQGGTKQGPQVSATSSTPEVETRYSLKSDTSRRKSCLGGCAESGSREVAEGNRHHLRCDLL